MGRRQTVFADAPVALLASPGSLDVDALDMHLPPDVFASDVRAMITLLHGCNDPRSDEERLLERLRAAGCNEAAVTALVECLDRKSVDRLACYRAVEGLEMAGVSIGVPTIGEVHVRLRVTDFI